MFKRDLLRRWPRLSRLLHQRWFQFALMWPGLLAFVVIIASGLFGIPIGAKNFAVVFVWIVWWALLIMLLVPFGARVWCTACPIPSLGEWLARRRFIGHHAGAPWSLNRRWPRRLRNLWLANFGFLSIALFSAIVTTSPVVTGALLLGLFVLAIVMHLVYERRAFCRYLCPVGGFLGLYSMVAPVELRRRSAETCLACKFKSCFRGSTVESLAVGGQGGYPCPMSEFPGAPMERNNYCILCTECIKACPYDNITINARPFGLDLYVQKGRKIDEAYKAFIMLGSALAYSLVMLGPHGFLKDWASLRQPEGFIVYAAGFLLTTLVVGPLLHLVATVLGRWIAGRLGHRIPLKELFVDASYALVPFGLMAWIAFSLSFVLPNLSYAIPTISDPFGWGWNLLGTASYPWTPYVPGWVPFLQLPVLLVGLGWGVLSGFRILRSDFQGDTRAAALASVPFAVYLTGLAELFLWLYLG
ncbi:MAG: 4Fe-4S binding protein [Limnochordaceae bacterium]|nr:4Fe-4S binding protein [Limnochordaceae bacterium]